MHRLRLAAAAQSDILGILAWSHERFGEAARRRYETLIVAGLRAIAARPNGQGSLARPELGAAVRSWHLRLSRDRAGWAGGFVQRPRHFLIYRWEPGLVVVGRVLHDAMELTRHVDPEGSWS